MDNKVNEFKNFPMVDFGDKAEEEKFKKGIELVRGKLGGEYPLLLDGRELHTAERIEGVNPNNTKEVIGRSSKADADVLDGVLKHARVAFESWRRVRVEERAACLLKLSKLLKERVYEMVGWMVLEVGKQWDQAYGEFGEAVDFLEYYAREGIRLGEGVRLMGIDGERNLQVYEPKGVVVVIAPWNFPFAISIGMIAAALVTGNTVVYKPSELSSVMGYWVTRLFREAGVPEGVLQMVSGVGGEIGDYLVEHPSVGMVAFTGSMQTGLRIIEKVAKVYPGQEHVKRVVCEMGGKNAIIVDEGADEELAVEGVLKSAFGYQGQKCSACSRLIVLEGIYDRFVEKLVEGAKHLRIGPAEDPKYAMGALINWKAVEKYKFYEQLAGNEGRVLYASSAPGGDGNYVPMKIVDRVTAQNRLMQEEIFGPLLGVIKVKTFEEGILVANAVRYGLTGGVYSMDKGNVERAMRELKACNVYINRGITGAMVGRQPFGGAFMSGGGTKAGGPEYLLNFVHPRVVTEVKVRGGFVSEGEGGR